MYSMFGIWLNFHLKSNSQPSDLLCGSNYLTGKIVSSFPNQSHSRPLLCSVRPWLRKTSVKCMIITAEAIAWLSVKACAYVLMCLLPQKEWNKVFNRNENYWHHFPLFSEEFIHNQILMLEYISTPQIHFYFWPPGMRLNTRRQMLIQVIF